MTNEEAKNILECLDVQGDGTILQHTWYNNIQKDTQEAIEMAIEALSKESCEDAISRKKLLKAIADTGRKDGKLVDDYMWVLNYFQIEGVVRNLPSVQPIISKMENVEDYISRQDILSKVTRVWNGGGDEDYKISKIRDYIDELPSVQPKLEPCEDCKSFNDIEEIGKTLLCDEGLDKTTINTYYSMIKMLPSVQPKMEECNDCISRQDVINMFNGSNPAFNLLQEAVKQLPSVEAEREWHTEQPTKGGRYICHFKLPEGEFIEFNLWIEDLKKWYTDGVIAWMPLPEPYKGK